MTPQTKLDTYTLRLIRGPGGSYLIFKGNCRYYKLYRLNKKSHSLVTTFVFLEGAYAHAKFKAQGLN